MKEHAKRNTKSVILHTIRQSKVLSTGILLTGAGKSTIFKLLLGQYQPERGHVRIYGQEASMIPDAEKRRLFGYVEQTFHAVPEMVHTGSRFLYSRVAI